MTVRKNFLLEDEVAKHLEEISKKQNNTQTAVIKELIEEKYMEISAKEKLEILSQLSGSMEGMFTNITVQEIKKRMGNNI